MVETQQIHRPIPPFLGKHTRCDQARLIPASIPPPDARNMHLIDAWTAYVFLTRSRPPQWYGRCWSPPPAVADPRVWVLHISACQWSAPLSKSWTKREREILDIPASTLSRRLWLPYFKFTASAAYATHHASAGEAPNVVP